MERGLNPHTKKAPLPHCALVVVVVSSKPGTAKKDKVRKKEQALRPGLFQLHTKDRATTPSPLPPGLVVPFPPPSRRGGRGQTTAPGSLRAQAPHPQPPSWLRSESPFSLPPPTSVTNTNTTTTTTRTSRPQLLTKAPRPALRQRRLNPGRKRKPGFGTHTELSSIRNSPSVHSDTQKSLLLI